MKLKKPTKSEAAPRIFCGDYFITRLENGMLWLGKKSGEGMQVNELKFEKTLRGFFTRHF